MNIMSGRPYPAGTLSNLAPHGFVFRGVKCNSMEGLLQGLKFKDPNMQAQICTLTGIKAKRSGQNKNWQRTQTLWWQGTPIKRDSQQYQELLNEAYNSLFKQNLKAAKALLSTGKAVLKHSIGRRKINETVLTQQEFCSRLTNMRELLRVEQFVTF